MTIHEPATLATDLLLAVPGFGLAWRLRRRVVPGNRAAFWWCAAMGAMAVSALVGGLYHGFAPNFPAAVDGVWWRLVLGLICVMGLTMEVSLIHEIAPDGNGWMRVVGVKFLLSLSAVMVWPDFLVAMADYGLAMLAWVAAALVLRRRWSAWMLAGVGLSAMAGWVQQSGWGLAPGFNHNDVFHVIQALAIVGFYRAGRLLGGEGGRDDAHTPSPGTVARAKGGAGSAGLRTGSPRVRLLAREERGESVSSKVRSPGL